MDHIPRGNGCHEFAVHGHGLGAIVPIDVNLHEMATGQHILCNTATLETVMACLCNCTKTSKFLFTVTAQGCPSHERQFAQAGRHRKFEYSKTVRTCPSRRICRRHEAQADRRVVVCRPCANSPTGARPNCFAIRCTIATFCKAKFTRFLQVMATASMLSFL